MECRLCNTNSLEKISTLSQHNIYLCKNCLLLQRIPLIENHTSSFEENEGYDWGITKEAGFIERVKNKETKWKFFTDKVSLAANPKILDFGSGFGALLEYLKTIGIDSIGIEPSKLNSEISKQKGHEVINGFLEKNTFTEKSFDVINISGVMQYIPNVREIFLIFNKILKEDGFILIDDKLYDWSIFNVSENLKYELTAQYYGKASLTNLFAITGFKVVYYKNLFGHLYLIAQKKNANSNLKGVYFLERLRIFFFPFTDFIFITFKSSLDKIYNTILKFKKN